MYLKNIFLILLNQYISISVKLVKGLGINYSQIRFIIKIKFIKYVYNLFNIFEEYSLILLNLNISISVKLVKSLRINYS